MGCVASTIETVELYSMLNQITKQAFRNVIAEDDLPGLAALDAQANYPTAIELSETGLLWTTIHFCCRFESPKCLQYFLRKCYLFQPNQYIRFVNHQTVEGNSCLHLCAIWNAKKCFALLVRYGGLNLDLKNKCEKGILSSARDYSRKTMSKTLNALHHIYSQVTPWNFELLQESIKYEVLSDKAFYDGIFLDIIKKRDEQIAEDRKGVQPTKQQLQLKEMKVRVEKEREDMHQKRILILHEKLEKQTNIEEKAKQGENQDVPDGPEARQNEKEKLSGQQLEIQRQFKIKEEELSNIKKAINLLRMQSAYKKLRDEQERGYKGRTSQKKIAQIFIQFRAHLLNLNAEAGQSKMADPLRGAGSIKQEEIVAYTGNELRISYVMASNFRSSILTYTNRSSCYTPPDLSELQHLPLNIQKKYVKAKKEGSFMDRQFPHSPQSLGGLEHQIKIKPFVDSTVWLRPDVFLGRGFKLFDGIHPNDAKQGLLGICYCLATVSTLACDPEEIKLIFPFHDLALGFYVLRFFISGKPNYVVLDDYFPCNASSFQPLFSKPIGKQVWVLLIEKAWAKLIGSYYAAELMTPDQFMEDLTGYPTLGAFFHKKKEPVKDIIECCKLGYPIVITSSAKKMEEIVSSHAYSLMKVYQLEDCRIYRLRNPWGRFQWNGRYGEQSALWTPDLKIKCEWVEGDDGIFFLSQAELLQAFEYYSIGFQQIGFNYSFLEFSSNHRQDKYFRFKHEGGKMSIRVSQPFKRMIKNSNYKYSGLLFEVGRIMEKQVVYISEGNQKCFHGQKSVYACNEVFTEYPAGEYFVRLRVEWIRQEQFNSAVISVYSAKKAQIQVVQPKEGYELWKQLLLSFARSKPLLKLNEDIDYNMNWMRGQMICYAELREDSKMERAKVNWLFNAEQMKNCQVRHGKVDESSLMIEVDKAHGNIGVIDRLSIVKSCSSGRVSIKATKV